jgi:hypothetical protein
MEHPFLHYGVPDLDLHIHPPFPQDIQLVPPLNDTSSDPIDFGDPVETEMVRDRVPSSTGRPLDLDIFDDRFNVVHEDMPWHPKSASHRSALSQTSSPSVRARTSGMGGMDLPDISMESTQDIHMPGLDMEEEGGDLNETTFHVYKFLKTAAGTSRQIVLSDVLHGALAKRSDAAEVFYNVLVCASKQKLTPIQEQPFADITLHFP